MWEGTCHQRRCSTVLIPSLTPEEARWRLRQIKSLSTSSFSISWVTRSPLSFWRDPTLFLVFLYRYKSLSCCPWWLARFNSIRALAFLTSSLAAQTISVHSSQATCPHPVQASILGLRLSRSSLFIHVGFLVFLPHFPFVGMPCWYSTSRCEAQISELMENSYSPNRTPNIWRPSHRKTTTLGN